MVSQEEIIRTVRDNPGLTLVELSMKIYGHSNAASTEFTNLKTKIYRMRNRDLCTVRRQDGAVIWMVIV